MEEAGEIVLEQMSEGTSRVFCRYRDKAYDSETLLGWVVSVAEQYSSSTLYSAVSLVRKYVR